MSVMSGDGDVSQIGAASVDFSPQKQLNNSNSSQDTFLAKLFDPCSDDPKGSVHRAWGLTLIFLVIYFTLSVIEST